MYNSTNQLCYVKPSLRAVIWDWNSEFASPFISHPAWTMMLVEQNAGSRGEDEGGSSSPPNPRDPSTCLLMACNCCLALLWRGLSCRGGSSGCLSTCHRFVCHVMACSLFSWEIASVHAGSLGISPSRRKQKHWRQCSMVMLLDRER